MATADIGSNTVHLLVAEVGRSSIRRLANVSIWLSLGQVVSKEGHIPKALAEQLVVAVKDFKKLAAQHRASEFYLFATEAMRKAQNHEQIVKRIRADTGIEMHIISPACEAEYSLAGALMDSGGLVPLTLVEIGGGSAQVAHWDGSRIDAQVSLPLGTGAVIVFAGLTQPCTAHQLKRLHAHVEQEAEKLIGFPSARRVVACGGVARGIVRAMHPDGAREIAIEELRFLEWDAMRLTVEQVVARYGVKPRRAETFLPGTVVFRRLLESLRHDEMLVSEYGVREGALAAVLDQQVRTSKP